MLESLFNKVVDLQPAVLLKKRLQQKCSPVILQKLLRTFLTEHLRVTASVQAFVSFNLAFFTSVDVTYDFLMISGEIEVD